MKKTLLIIVLLFCALTTFTNAQTVRDTLIYDKDEVNALLLKLKDSTYTKEQADARIAGQTISGTPNVTGQVPAWDEDNQFWTFDIPAGGSDADSTIFSTIFSTDTKLAGKSDTGHAHLAYPTNVVKSGTTFYFRNADNDTLFTATDAVGEPGGGIASVSEDDAPVLGGNLDLGDFSITNTTPTFTLTPTELGYVVGVTSAIQTQLNAKASNAGLDSLKDEKIDKDYSAYPSIPSPEFDASILIFQNDTSGTTTVDKLPISQATQTALNGKEPANANIQSHISSSSNPHGVTKTDVGLGNVPNTDATNPANITQSSSYRFTTDTEKSTWNGKQDALGFTPENNTNKATNLTDPDNTKYPTTLAVSTALSGKQNTLESGTNIKTINSESLLGSGNIAIEGTVDTSGDIASKAYVENAINAIPEDSIGITGAEFNTWIDNFRGGTTNQIWKKDSNSDFDGSWIDNTGGSGLTQEQETQLEVTWAYLQLDTTGSFLESFTAQTDVELETLTESDIIEVDVDDTYGITRVAVDSGQYAVLYDLRGTPTWSDWTSTEAWYKGVDSAKVRHYSATTPFTETTQELFIADDSEIFSVTTAVSGYDTESLLYDYIYTSLTPGTVTANEWEDETANIPFTNVDGTPTMVADSGVVLNSGDDIWRACASISGEVSVEMIIMLSDTAAVEGTWIKLRNGSGMEINSISSHPLYIFGVTGFDGSTHYKTSIYPTPLEGNFVHVVATFDGVSDPKVYFNTVLQDDFGSTAIPNVSTGDQLVLGYGTGSLTPNEIIRLVRIYTKVLTTEINGNYGWAQSQGLVP